MKKQLKLKGWVKVALGLIVLGYLVVMYVASVNQIKVKAVECDNAKGYTCSYYEVQKFMRGE